MYKVKEKGLFKSGNYRVFFYFFEYFVECKFKIKILNLYVN